MTREEPSASCILHATNLEGKSAIISSLEVRVSRQVANKHSPCPSTQSLQYSYIRILYHSYMYIMKRILDCMDTILGFSWDSEPKTTSR